MTYPTILHVSMLQPGDIVKFHDAAYMVDDAHWLVLNQHAPTNGVLLEFLYGAGPHPWPPFGRTWTLYSDDPQLGHGDLL